MANEPLIKTRAGLETKDFNKGVSEMKRQMKDLEKVSGDAFSTIADALGIDLGKLQQFSSALSGLGNKLAQTGKEGTTAFQAISKSIAPVAAGIAGLGLTAAIALFKQLNAEADAFEATVQGGIIRAQSEAYTSTFRQFLRDQRNLGEGASQARSSFREGWVRFLAGMNPMNNLDVLTAADEAAKQAKEYTGEILQLERQRKENAVEVAKLNDKIAEYTNIAKDSTNSVAARQAAMAQIEAAIAEKKALTVPLEERLAELYELRSALAEDSVADADAVLSQQQRLYDTNRAITQEETAQLKLKTQVAAAAEAAAKAAKEEADNIKRVAELQANLSPIMADFSRFNRAEIPVKPTISPNDVHEFKEHIIAELGGGITIAIALDPDSVEKIHDISNEIVSVAQSMAENVGSAIGTLLGDLATGGNAWDNFANAALSAFGDMAISIGKIAISTGLASEGIKAALSLDNPYIAIAAGVALVALGTAVKAGLSNISSGNYSSGTGVATSNTTSSFNNAYEQRDVYVNVQGTLVADGDQLLAVINNTDKKNYFTT